MITHVQTTLRKAGNYDKTGRARKNMRAVRFSCTKERVGGGRSTAARKHVALGSSQAVTLCNTSFDCFDKISTTMCLICFIYFDKSYIFLFSYIKYHKYCLYVSCIFFQIYI